MSKLNLSVRAYHCILKLARTIADLAGNELWEAEQQLAEVGAQEDPQLTDFFPAQRDCLHFASSEGTF
jgi:hypothetical protein